MQVASDPEHPNRHHGTRSHQPSLGAYAILKRQQAEKWKSCSLSEPNGFEMKNKFIYI